MSVVMITTDDFETLRHTAAALRAQSARDQLEIVVVTPATTVQIPDDELVGFSSVKIVECPQISSTAAMRVAGVRASTAQIVAFTEDHCLPGASWAAALIERHRGPWTGVGAAFANANPGRTLSWANFLIEYGEWAAPQAGGEVHHIGGHNSSYKRDVLCAYGDPLAQVMEAESTMQWELAGAGHRFYLEPRAVMHHLNFSRFLPSIWLRFFGGRLFAANRARPWNLWRRLVYLLGSPLIPLVRMSRVLRAMHRIGRLDLLPRALPAILFLLAIDGLGEAIGYGSGSGRAMELVSDAEFHRERYLADPAGELAAARALAAGGQDELLLPDHHPAG